MATMASCVPVFLLLLTYTFSGMVEGCSGNMNNFRTLNKEGVQVNSRKLMVHYTILDYDYAGPNSKHDPPRKGKPANGGGKNP